MNEQMLKTLRRLCISAAAFCLLLSGIRMTYAESVSFETDEYTWFLNNSLLNEEWVIHDGIFTVDGQPAYCIEPKETVVIGEDLYETADWETYSGYSDEVKQKIAEYACFGYGSEGFTDMESWYAAQILIWQCINPAFGQTRVYKDPSYDGSRYMSSNAYEITGIIHERMKALQDKIDRFHTAIKPSCLDEADNLVTLPAEVLAGDILRIHDEAGVLMDYRLMNPQPGVKHQGNDVIIDTSHMSSVTLTFRYEGLADPMLSAPLVLKSRDGSKIQTLVIRGRCELNDFEIPLAIKDAKLRMRKTDSSEGTQSPNAAELKGAQYELCNETLRESCGIFVTDENGLSNVIEGLNSADVYSLKEVQAPKGYQADSAVHTFRLRDLDQIDGVYEIRMSDAVIASKVAIHKVIANKENSDLAVNEAGAHFAILSEKAIRRYGSFEAAMDHYDEIGALEKSIIVTDENGYGQSGMLAYGRYTARQIKASDENLQLCEDFSFVIDEVRTDPPVFEVSNLPAGYHLRIIKKDAADGSRITYTPAAFQIYDQSGNLVVSKVGSAVYDTFATSSLSASYKNAKNVYVDTSSKEGEVVLPLPLNAGRYELREVSAPYGYLLNPKPLFFEITAAAVREGEIRCVEVMMENEMRTGSVRIHKRIAKTDSDRDLFNHDDLSGIVFTLYADEDIRSCKDGSVLYEKGQKVISSETDEKGNAAMGNLPFGRYVLKETAVKAGLIPNEKEEEILIDDEKTEYSFEIVNQEVKTVFSKKAATGSDEVPGAHLSVTEEDGTPVDAWISSDRPHVICGLDPEKTYILKEEISPGLSQNGSGAYAKAQKIRFTPSADASGSTVTMKNTLVKAAKYNESSERLSGAQLCVLDENNEIVDEWISDESEHVIHHLQAGKTYTLCETKAPEGYYLSHDVTFTVSGEEDQRIIMRDAPIRANVRKIEESSGKDLPGVTLKLYEVNGEEETILQEWVSTDSPKEIGHLLKAGTMYRLEEAESVRGVYPAADLYFRTDLYDPEDDTPLSITMIDASVALAAVKTDVNGRYLTGAHMCLCDEDENVLYEWISGSGPEDLSPYVKGNGRYEIRETASPQGYALADPLTFTVNGNTSKHQMVRAVDRNVRIHLSVVKTDSETGTPLEDCEVTVFKTADHSIAYDASGNKAKLRTDENGEARVTLPYEAEGYYVLETKAPKGYAINRSRFDVSAKRENNPAVLFEEIKISDEKKTVPTGVGSGNGWLLINAGAIMACTALILQCVSQSKSRR